MKDKIFDVPFVLGISVSVPKERVVMKDLQFDGVDLDNVIKTTGIHEVRRAPANMTATDYCLNAAEHLFEELNFDKNQIDGIVFATPISDYLTPGSGYVVQARLNLSTRCIVVDINQACAGFVNGLFNAFMLVQSGYCKNVLLCAGDTAASVHPKDKSMQMLLGDAGAVAIISANNNLNKSAFSFYNDGRLLEALYLPAGGKRLPIKHGVTNVEVLDEQGNVHTLESMHMDGLEVMSFAIAGATATIKDLFKTMGWTKDDVKIFALHQANKSIVTAITRRFRIPAEKVPITFTHYGNTAGASTPLTLCFEHSRQSQICLGGGV